MPAFECIIRTLISLAEMNAMMTFALLLWSLQFSFVLSFLPGHTKFAGRLNGLGRARSKSEQRDLKSKLHVDKEVSKFSENGSPGQMSDSNSARLNIFSTLQPKLIKSEQLLHKFASGHVDRHKRRPMHAKMDFYSSYTAPILPQYSAFLSDLISVVFSQTAHELYVYDPLHAFGLCTQYFTIMKEYVLPDQVDPIFNALMQALRMDPQLLRTDATRILQQVDSTQSVSDEQLLTTESELGRTFQKARENKRFHYTDAWGIGLGRLLELRSSRINPTNPPDFSKWSQLLLRVPAERLEQSWAGFTEQQRRMQSFEATRRALIAQKSTTSEYSRTHRQLYSLDGNSAGKEKGQCELNRR